MTAWTFHDIPDLTGRVAIVTGANSGVGYVAARELAGHGARVIAAGRSAERGRAAVEEIRAERPGADIRWARLDLADLSSVRTFADNVLAGEDVPDLLINNAGIGWFPRQETADGFEQTFGTNHLGPFVLTATLLPVIAARPDARIITVASDVHEWRQSRLDIADLQSARGGSRMARYARSKLANVLFAFELHRRVAAAGLDLRSVAVNPGATVSQLGPKNARGFGAVRWLMDRFLQPTEVGAAPTLYAATATDVNGGDYIQPERLNGPPGKHWAASWAYDETAAARLWEESERLTGVSFGVNAIRQ